MLLLEAHHVKHYVQERLLLDVDQLQIHQSDRIGLVGRNGSGKTTLLQILAEKISPEEGTVIQRTQCELLPIIVSHDRAFLDALCTTIWEINEGKIRGYTGNYSHYVEQKEVESHQEQLAYEKYEKKEKAVRRSIKIKREKSGKSNKSSKKR
ncbi:ATP-binding cassette domain-containing protein [Aneurinibacillus tyrosinisolvens]|uniref:ATP-binding cassette domain-containing protein n=1 Tax=Aneurinibacillus tyrosinisolvens TaxID=1443435 RepID=UPI000A5ED7DB|nr:ATP-binding cassette domain-containing protein [Aneurinibacillus tyrosinisolvens]